MNLRKKVRELQIQIDRCGEVVFELIQRIEKQECNTKRFYMPRYPKPTYKPGDILVSTDINIRTGLKDISRIVIAGPRNEKTFTYPVVDLSNGKMRLEDEFGLDPIFTSWEKEATK